MYWIFCSFGYDQLVCNAKTMQHIGMPICAYALQQSVYSVYIL